MGLKTINFRIVKPVKGRGGIYNARVVARTGTTTIYKAKDGYRWRSVIGGRCVAESGEAYKRPGYTTKQAGKYGPAGFRVTVKSK